MIRQLKEKPLIRNAWRSYRIILFLLCSKDLSLSLDPIRIILKVKPFTMASLDRLLNVYETCMRAEAEKIPGSFVECGVWRGGCAGIMGYIAEREQSGRQIHLFDSFEGLPAPIADLDGSKANSYASGKSDGELSPIGKCFAPIEDVKQLFFQILNLDPARIVFHQGWFQDTLPVAAPHFGPIAVLRLDGDWYASTKVCLDFLYDKVSKGGYVIIDDYGHWEGCRRAVDEFFDQRQLRVDLQRIDSTGRYFRKPF